MLPADMNVAYTSIFLEDDWAHQCFYGWRVIEQAKSFRVLGKRVGPLTRSLVLAREAESAEIRAAICKQISRGLLHETVVHNFAVKPEANEWFLAQGFRIGNESERLLNTATFVLDLKAPLETLLGNMTSDYRRKIRKAENRSVVVNAFREPSGAMFLEFVDRLNALSREQNFSPIDPDVLLAMYAQKRAVMFVVEVEGITLGYLHVYLAGTTGMFMYGVSLEKHNDGAGQFLHWQIMNWLKDNGYCWYDLGGVASQEQLDGIYRFKAGFGGAFVELGSEWVRRGAGFQAALKLRQFSANAKRWGK